MDNPCIFAASSQLVLPKFLGRAQRENQSPQRGGTPQRENQSPLSGNPPAALDSPHGPGFTAKIHPDFGFYE
ncbi:hypothetical protein DP113_27965 [Brasilonema octagenarum UFV-E1]|nr:hypothetical protein DP113_27965 [Brasilonema octagenarum UFV-E1]